MILFYFLVLWSVSNKNRLVHLDFEVRSEELLAPALLCHKEPVRSKLVGGFGTKYPPTLVLYGIRAPTIGPFRAWKPHPLCHKEPERSKQRPLDQ